MMFFGNFEVFHACVVLEQREEGCGSSGSSYKHWKAFERKVVVCFHFWDGRYNWDNSLLLASLGHVKL